jgi:hypothetical protein
LAAPVKNAQHAAGQSGKLFLSLKLHEVLDNRVGSADDNCSAVVRHYHAMIATIRSCGHTLVGMLIAGYCQILTVDAHSALPQ